MCWIFRSSTRITSNSPRDVRAGLLRPVFPPVRFPGPQPGHGPAYLFAAARSPLRASASLRSSRRRRVTLPRRKAGNVQHLPGGQRPQTRPHPGRSRPPRRCRAREPAPGRPRMRHASARPGPGSPGRTSSPPVPGETGRNRTHPAFGKCPDVAGCGGTRAAHPTGDRGALRSGTPHPAQPCAMKLTAAAPGCAGRRTAARARAKSRRACCWHSSGTRRPATGIPPAPG